MSNWHAHRTHTPTASERSNTDEHFSMWRLRCIKKVIMKITWNLHCNKMKRKMQFILLGDRHRHRQRARERLPNSCAKYERGECVSHRNWDMKTGEKRRRTRITGIAIIDESCAHILLCVRVKLLKQNGIDLSLSFHIHSRTFSVFFALKIVVCSNAIK